MSIISIRMPLPPSVNASYASNPRKPFMLIRTAKYNFWLKQVEEECKYDNLESVPEGENYALHLKLPGRMRGDIDNRVKPVSDMLQKLGVIKNDRFMSDLFVSKEPQIDVESCYAIVVPETEWYKYLHEFIG